MGYPRWWRGSRGRYGLGSRPVIVARAASAGLVIRGSGFGVGSNRRRSDQGRVAIRMMVRVASIGQSGPRFAGRDHRAVGRRGRKRRSVASVRSRLGGRTRDCRPLASLSVVPKGQSGKRCDARRRDRLCPARRGERRESRSFLGRRRLDEPLSRAAGTDMALVRPLCRSEAIPKHAKSLLVVGRSR